MTAQEIRIYMEAAPFIPVNLVTFSGDSYLIPHPDFLTFSPTGRTCLVYAEDGEFFTALNVGTIADVEPVRRRAAGAN